MNTEKEQSKKNIPGYAKSSAYDVFSFKPVCGAEMFVSKTEKLNAMKLRMHKKTCKNGCADAPVNVEPTHFLGLSENGKSIAERHRALQTPKQ